MAKGKPDPEWQKKVKIWQTSGKSAREWCKEHDISIQTFYTWKKRLKFQKHVPLHKQEFIELKDKVSNNAILLEYQAFKIHLPLDFDVVQLKRCLAALKDVIC